ncbi:MAG TPA: class I SAM-dependent methyltransferase, partial [Chitinophagaceae bacterium]
PGKEEEKMMSVREHYNDWSATYDSVENKTRDLEAIACRTILSGSKPDSVIEIGCGTGKNTSWFATIATNVTAVDFSEQMLEKAAAKVSAANVVFRQADISLPWRFTDREADLISCSLVLEHIGDLQHVFNSAGDHLRKGGLFYICELHPCKQYSGSKARFESQGALQVLQFHVHHLSDYLSAAAAAGFRLQQLNEWFDEPRGESMPRLLSFLFSK